MRWAPGSTLLHQDAMECTTGDEWYDAQTRLNLRSGVRPNGLPTSPPVLEVTCARPRGQRHPLGAVYALPGNRWLLLARYDSSGRNRPKVGGFTTIRVQYVAATLLNANDLIVSAVGCGCGEVSLTPSVRSALVDAARLAGRGRGPTRHALREPRRD